MENGSGAILIVDDDDDILMAGKLLLGRHFAQVDTCRDPNEIPALMAATNYAAILLDMNFGPGESSGEQGFHWLGVILERDPDAVVVLITAHGGVDVAVRAMKVGATDFISKPWQNEKVVATLSAAVKLNASRTEAKRLQQANAELVEATGTSEPMLGQSRRMQDVFNMIQRAAPTDANVLLLGENGTGKELAARALHRLSNRADEVFMAVDLGAVAETLFESELFGHVKGAFTGAIKDRVGRVQASNGGTLFLDEVGNLPLHLQAKLLSMLEQRQVTPIGATSPVPVDVRVIAATNLTAAALKDESRFRQDLLFRLNTVEIVMPPLRERKEDIPIIADHFAELYARKYGKPAKPLNADSQAAIAEYPWPGNVRALRHAIERAVILSDKDELVPADFQLDPIGPNATPRSSERAASPDLNLSNLEKRTIEEALLKHEYNISKAAKELGLTRAALYRRMEKHEI